MKACESDGLFQFNIPVDQDCWMRGKLHEVDVLSAKDPSPTRINRPFRTKSEGISKRKNSPSDKEKDENK